MSGGADHRYARDVRLTTSADYRAVFDRAHACSSEYFTFLGIDNGRRQGRLGLAIAKRRIARAFRRNVIKRIVRESFRHHQRELTGLDIVVIARNAAATADKRQLRQTLDQQWQRLAARVRGGGH